MKGAFSGDWHYGLHVEELDRTKEVHTAVNDIVDWVIESGVDFFSVGGDLLHNNNPHPDYIAFLIQIFNRLEDAEIPTFVTKGNHCAISAPGKVWALTPLEQVGYQNVYFITEPTAIELQDAYFIFLPHITRSQAIELGYASAQECVDKEAERLLQDMPEGKKALVVSHYNVNGAIAGTEKMMLRQSDLQLPAIVQRSPKVDWVINSHIHTAQYHGNKIVMPGSPICTDFGDLEAPKGFASAELTDEGWEFSRIPTLQATLQEFDVDLIGKSAEEIEKELTACVEEVLKDAIVKVRIVIEEEKLPYVDFDTLKKSMSQRAKFVKNFDKVITKKRAVRDSQQKPTLSPIEAVKRYVDNVNPEGADRKLNLAMKVIEGGQIEIQETEGKFENPTAAADDLDVNMENLEKLADEEVIVEGTAVVFDEPNINGDIVEPDAIDFSGLDLEM